ncbi:MAG: protein translocase subunit SecD [Patescibacteria group bacterium]|jgi:protein-export membrane protein SecD
MANKSTKITKANPRKVLRWAIFGIIVLFVVTLFVDLLGTNNLVTNAIDQGITSIPVVNTLKIWPSIEKNPTDGSNLLAWKNIKEIDLRSYGPYFHLGLDLQGGSDLVYNADVSKIPQSGRADALAGVRDVIERRVNSFGVSEPLVQTNQVGNQWRVLVELAGVYDVNQAIKMIGETPLLEFKTENPNANTKLTADQQKQLDDLNAQVKTTADDVLKQAQSGSDFAELAKKYSEDPGSKDDGGLYKAVKKGDMVTEFDKVIFDENFKVGTVWSQLVQTQYGYHIIKLEAKNGSGDGETVDIRHILVTIKGSADIGVQLQSEWIATELTGKQLKKASVEFDPNTSMPQVSLEFDSEGAKLFGEITKANVGKLVAIFLDGEAISIPRVETQILDGKAVINGTFTLEEAKLLSQRLNAGALPVPISLVSQTTVGASLGNDSIHKSLIAGIYGLLLIALFMILYYRLPGVISVVALIIYTTIALALFKLIPVTMTLAGIAGFILSIGMAVDANVLIFARLKEELKSGRDLGVAVDEGFHRAWASIRDSNISSLITCAILYWFGSSIIKGFAFTLALGIIISMFSAITITRQLLKLIVKWKWCQNRWLYAVKENTKVQ